MAQKASLYRLLLHRYGSHFCTDMRYITYSMSHEQISALPRWYGRTVTVREVAGASSRETRSRTRTRIRTRTESRRCTAGRRPRAPGDQPDGRRHGRRAYPAAGQEHGTGARPLPTGARVAVSALPVRPHGAFSDDPSDACPGQRAHRSRLTGGQPDPLIQLLQPHTLYVRGRARGVHWLQEYSLTKQRHLAAQCSTALLGVYGERSNTLFFLEIYKDFTPEFTIIVIKCTMHGS